MRAANSFVLIVVLVYKSAHLIALSGSTTHYSLWTTYMYIVSCPSLKERKTTCIYAGQAVCPSWALLQEVDSERDMSLSINIKNTSLSKSQLHKVSHLHLQSQAGRCLLEWAIFDVQNPLSLQARIGHFKTQRLKAA